MRTIFQIALVAALPLAAQTGLTVKAATNKHVDLTWSGTASSYAVQRAVSGGSFVTLSTAATTSFSDTTIDPYTAYQYQVSAGQTTSNAVTIGPPPAGFSAAAPAPGISGGDVADDYGYNIALTLDGNGDPAFLFLFNDPNRDGDPSDTTLLFRSWNRAAYAWNPVVTIATVGDAADQGHNSTAIAYDTSTNMFVAASEINQASSIKLWTSSDGVTWSLKTTITRTNSNTHGPAVALEGGNIYFAFTADQQGLFYLTGKLSAAGSSWAQSTAPRPAGTGMAYPGISPSLALDSNGNPAIAYWVPDTTNSQNDIVEFWRPGSAPQKVTDTQGTQSFQEAVKLLFYNLEPRILFYGQRNDAISGLGDHFVRSDDGGVTWQTPVVIPPDGDATTDFPFDMALDSRDNVAVAFGQNGTGNAGNGAVAMCGNPKLSLSADLTNFNTCAAADVSITGSFEPYPDSIQVVYGGNDRLYLFWKEKIDNGTGLGVLMWRQPPLGASTNPSINTDGTGVMNGAINTPGSGIVEGSWVTIKGANFSNATLNWSNQDFSNGLPTSLNGVQVLMNGKAAPLKDLLSGQVNVQAPASVSASGNVSVQVVNNGAPSNIITVPSVPTAPGLFVYSLDGGKTYWPASVFPDGTYVADPAIFSGSRKAKAGDIILLFATGLGTSPPGVIIDSPITFSNPVQVTIGSQQASVPFVGLVAPGEWQLNVVVPSGLADGNQAIILSTGGQSSQSGIVIPITH